MKYKIGDKVTLCSVPTNIMETWLYETNQFTHGIGGAVLRNQELLKIRGYIIDGKIIYIDPSTEHASPYIMATDYGDIHFAEVNIMLREVKKQLKLEVAV